jgi:CDP-diacylglycerol--glycerol-3-phosphate 3-phosphatidyltransferase
MNNNHNKNIEEYGENRENNERGAPRINLPNKLTIFRIILVPCFMVFILLPQNGILTVAWMKIFASALFLIAALTDLLDGILARRLNLITDFGIFMDAVADKFMVVGAMVAITGSPHFEGIRFFSVWATSIVFFRELAVTSIRLVANAADGNVIAAKFVGKLKTFLQCACILTILLEDVAISQNLNTPPYLFGYITMVLMLVATVYSGFVYFKAYWKYIDPAK